MEKVIVIGAGPSGIISAIEASKRGKDVYLFEKNNKIGKKLYITGKGRCNITNSCDVDTLLENIPTNPYFLYSAFYSLDSYSLMNYFKNIGVDLKVERGNRVFPQSDKSITIINALEKELKKNRVKIILNTEIIDIIVKENKIIGVLTNKEKINADSVIIATGGLSYPSTGSTGDGYKFAKKVGHNVTPLFPSLVGLKLKEDFVNSLSGLSLKNISITLKLKEKILYKDFGEMLFTHNGVSGPLILSASRHFIDVKKQKCNIFIDLKPALTDKQLDTRILRDFLKYKNKDIKNAFTELLPQSIIPVIIKMSLINPEKKVFDITKEERKNLVKIIKNLKFSVIDTEGYNQAVITCGGVNTKEIDPTTMESKKIKNLFFVGEVIDVDAYTGGFNLQIAFSTGFLAGQNC